VPLAIKNEKVLSPATIEKLKQAAAKFKSQFSAASDKA